MIPLLRRTSCPTASLIALASLAVLALQALGCGSNNNTTRSLQSVSVTPAIATAHNFPNGHVQFTATGTFTKAPSPAVLTFQPPYSGSFNIDLTVVKIVSKGTGTITVQCVQGASGKTTISAVACRNATGTGITCTFDSGSAELSCP